MTRVVSIGECMIELSGREGVTWRQGYAGDTLNTLWYLRALSAPSTETDYVSAFGDDPFSHEQIAFLRANGIGVAASPTIPGKAPGLYAITLDAHGERSFTYWRQNAAARCLADDYDALAESLSGAGLIYLSGITLAILDERSRDDLLSIIETARARDTVVAFDPNYRPRLWADPGHARTVMRGGYAAASIVLPTFDDEQALFGDANPMETIERIRHHGPGGGWWQILTAVLFVALLCLWAPARAPRQRFYSRGRWRRCRWRQQVQQHRSLALAQAQAQQRCCPRRPA